MKRRLGLVLAVLLPWAARSAPEVPSERIAEALASRPAADDTFVKTECARAAAGAWVAAGTVVGRTVFEEDFSDRSAAMARWRFDRGASLGADGRGGVAARIVPQAATYAQFTLAEDRWLQVDVDHPLAVLWEARTPQGGLPPSLRLDYYDAGRRHLRAHQMLSAVDPTELGVFHRNGFFVTPDMPRRTAFLRLQFNHAKTDLAREAGEIARVRVVDLTALSAAALKAREKVRRIRREAGDRVLVYADDNLTSCYPVLPQGETVPGEPCERLRLRECPGEKTRASVVLWSAVDRGDVTVRISDLTGERGTIPAAAVSVKVVKSHYQANGAPYSNVALDLDQVLVPELLLNDENLVVADHVRRRNYLRCCHAGRTWHADVNADFDHPFDKVRLDESRLPIRDADSLRPFRLEAGLSRQLALRVSVPDAAAAGRYEGRLDFISAGRSVAALRLSLDVLPFRLPAAAETAYDSAKRYTMGLYVWTSMSGDGRGSMSTTDRSRTQTLGVYRLLRDNGVTTPTFIWPNDEVVFDERRFREHLGVAREAGFRDELYLGWSGAIGNAHDAESLGAMQARLRAVMKTAREYGFGQVYFYGFDEAVGERLVSQLTAWRAARATGAKTFVSGYAGEIEKVMRELDLCVWNSEPERANPADWHALGHRLWKYGTPQTGPEIPDLFRRNYGLLLWSQGFDGGNTYCETTLGLAWNDLYQLQRNQVETKKRALCYRSESVVYPTLDGAVETLALTGLESAIKDVRYVTKLRQLLRERPDPDTEAWLAGLDFKTADLAAVRRSFCDRILRLLSR